MTKRFSVVGQPLPKIDAWGKVTGDTRYTDDLVLPRMAFGKLLRSPHAHARIRGIDTTRARVAAAAWTSGPRPVTASRMRRPCGTGCGATDRR